jgi:cell division protein FtsQ
MADSEVDDQPRPVSSRLDGVPPGEKRFDGSRMDRPHSRWYRPASAVGRVFLFLFVMLLLGGLAASAYLLKTWLARDSRFRINAASNIHATGLTEVSRAQMLPVFGEDIGRNIFFVPLGERRRQLEEIPWIEKATVMRLLPDQIRVSVVERQPVAFVLQQDGRTGLVDPNGVLLAMPAAMMAQNHYSFPVVSGIDAHDPPASRKGRMAVYQRLLAELDSNGQHISAQISEINLTDPADAQVLMPEQGGDILAHFGDDHFLERYQRYKAHIAEWRQKYPKLAAVDLRYDQQVVLQMAPGSSVAQAAADEQAATSADSGASMEQDKPSAPDPAETNPDKANTVAGTASSLKAAGSADAKPPAKPKPAPNAALKTSVKTAPVKARAKKRAAVKRAALNVSRQKKVRTTNPAASAGIGQ